MAVPAPLQQRYKAFSCTSFDGREGAWQNSTMTLGHLRFPELTIHHMVSALLLPVS